MGLARRGWLLPIAVLVAGCTGSSPAPPPQMPPTTTGGAAPLRMLSPRAAHTATPLPDGRVLIVGGCVRDGCEGMPAGGRSELFDPGSATFAVGPPLHRSRGGHTATALADGRVLVTGGYPDEGRPPLDSAEVYDPGTNRFDAVAAMTAARGAHTATRLPDGRVLVVGGVGEAGPLAGAEVFDPASGRFAPVTPLPGPRATHAAALLADGRVLVAGGQSGRTTLLDTAVTYQPATDTWSEVGRLATAKYKLALAPLHDGGALLVGGQTRDARDARLSTTELFDPGTNRFAAGPTMAEPRFKISDAVLALPDGRVVIGGGTGVEVYANGALRRLPVATGPERQFPALAPLPGERVLVTGGYDNATRVTASAVVVPL